MKLRNILAGIAAVMASGCASHNHGLVENLLSNHSEPASENRSERNKNWNRNCAAEAGKYALVLVASSARETDDYEVLDPIDVNCDWISAVHVYNALRKLNIPHENIYLLYADGIPPEEETLPEADVEFVKKHEFSGEYSNLATEQNLNGVLNLIAGKMKNTDVFVMYVLAHGDEIGNLYFDFDDNVWQLHEINAWLNKMKYKQSLLFFNSCFSGLLTNEVGQNKDIVVSATQPDKTAWVDRNFNSGDIFFSALSDIINDSNGNGVVSAEEAMNALSEEGKKYWPALREYLLDSYQCDTLKYYPYARENFVKEISLEPMMSKGSGVKTDELERILEN